MNSYVSHNISNDMCFKKTFLYLVNSFSFFFTLDLSDPFRISVLRVFFMITTGQCSFRARATPTVEAWLRL